MNTYKITNITHLAHKRDTKYNSPINIEYVDNRVKKIATINAGDTMFLTVRNIPLSLHRLRIKNLVSISEISPAELREKIEPAKPKGTKKKAEKVTVETKPEKKTTTTVKKKIASK